MANKYLSDFELAFELDNETSSYSDASTQNETDYEYNYESADDELEDDYENVLNEMDNEEGEMNDEWEDELDNETDDELEEAETDYASWSRDGRYDRDHEFENRLFNALASNTDNELQTELELDNVLHEMERDYFFGGVGNWLQKKARKYGQYALPGYAALKGVTALGRQNIRNLLKNKLLQTAASFVPGAGPIISQAMGVASNVMNTADAAKEKIQDIVQVGKDAYTDLASAVPEAQNEMEVKRASNIAWKTAISNHQLRKANQVRDHRRGAGTGHHGHPGRTKRIINTPVNARIAVFATKVFVNRHQKHPIKPNSIVIVRPGKLIIWELK
jgi:hypothetical protein